MREQVNAVSTRLISSPLYFCYVFPLVKVGNKASLWAQCSPKKIFFLQEKNGRRRHCCWSLDSFVQKPFHQADAQSKLKPNPFSPCLNVIIAKVQCLLRHEAEAAQRQRKKNEHTNESGDSCGVAVSGCAHVGGREWCVNELLYA